MKYAKTIKTESVISEVKKLCSDPHCADDDIVTLCIGKLLSFLNSKLTKKEIQAVSMLMQLQRREYDLNAMRSNLVVARPRIVTL